MNNFERILNQTLQDIDDLLNIQDELMSEKHPSLPQIKEVMDRIHDLCNTLEILGFDITMNRLHAGMKHLN